MKGRFGGGAARDGARPARRIQRQIRLSGLALAWERLCPALWPAAACVGVFAAASLFGLWEAVPWPWLHAALLAGFAAAFAAALWRARGAARSPGREAAVRRLERGSGVRHRPIETLADAPAGGRGEALWAAHRRRAERMLRGLHARWPRPTLAARDPWAFRALLLLALAVSGLAAGDRAGARFAAALAFDYPGIEIPPGRLTAWIDPPPHTGLAPIFLTPADGAEPGGAAPAGAHEVVAGSVLHARVFGGEGAPALTAATEDSAAERPFDSAGAGNFTLQYAFEANTETSIAQDGRELGAWTVYVVADRPPDVESVRPPETTRYGVVRLNYAATDDFGVDSVYAHIRRGEEDDAWPIELELPLPDRQPTVVREASYHDLTSHPWAGLEVELEFAATDNAGQRSAAAIVPMLLPWHGFSHPVAEAIALRRRDLGRDRGKAPETIAALEDMLAAPEEFSGDTLALLGLSSARTRLELARNETDYRAVIDLLWDLALHLEKGALGHIERELRAVQEALREALETGAPQEEISELMERLSEAMERYLDRMSQREQDGLEDGEDTALDAGRMQRGREDLRQMIETARDMAETGARDAARRMLQRLQDMLENMEVARPEENPQTAGGDSMTEELRALMEEQDELLEETYRRARQEGENERLSAGEDATAAERQEALRRALGELMRRMGESGEAIPRPLGAAERNMLEARDELARGRPDRAAENQAEALSQLMAGAEIVMDLDTTGESGQRPNRRGARRDELRDPFGRLPPGDGGDPGGFVEVPTQAAVQRSREIRDELRRRAGERSRPRGDLDYIRRLLDMY